MYIFFFIIRPEENNNRNAFLSDSISLPYFHGPIRRLRITSLPSRQYLFHSNDPNFVSKNWRQTNSVISRASFFFFVSVSSLPPKAILFLSNNSSHYDSLMHAVIVLPETGGLWFPYETCNKSGNAPRNMHTEYFCNIHILKGKKKRRGCIIIILCVQL